MSRNLGRHCNRSQAIVVSAPIFCNSASIRLAPMTLCHWRLTLVTERTQLKASTSYTVLLKVTQPRDELTYGASRIVLQQRNAVRPSARSHNGPLLMSVPSTQPFPSRGHESFDGCTSHRKNHRSPERVQPRQDVNRSTAHNGSGVPRPS